MQEVHENHFIPHLPQDICIVGFFSSLNLRGGLLVCPFNELESFIRVFDLLTFFYLLILVSVQSTHYFIFIIYQVSYNSLI